MEDITIKKELFDDMLNHLMNAQKDVYVQSTQDVINEAVGALEGLFVVMKKEESRLKTLINNLDKIIDDAKAENRVEWVVSQIKKEYKL